MIMKVLLRIITIANIISGKCCNSHMEGNVYYLNNEESKYCSYDAQLFPVFYLSD